MTIYDYKFLSCLIRLQWVRTKSNPSTDGHAAGTNIRLNRTRLYRKSIEKQKLNLMFVPAAICSTFTNKDFIVIIIRLLTADRILMLTK